MSTKGPGLKSGLFCVALDDPYWDLTALNTHSGALGVVSLPRFIKTFILFWPVFEVTEDNSHCFLLIDVYFVLLRKKQVVLRYI